MFEPAIYNQAGTVTEQYNVSLSKAVQEGRLQWFNALTAH